MTYEPVGPFRVLTVNDQIGTVESLDRALELRDGNMGSYVLDHNDVRVDTPTALRNFGAVWEQNHPDSIETLTELATVASHCQHRRIKVSAGALVCSDCSTVLEAARP
jgi:hypothetical protein